MRRRRSGSCAAEHDDEDRRSPAQPRASLERELAVGDTAAVDAHVPLANADVLEVIAEYACATVTNACALRAANKGYRRAVDTTVRRLVYEDQPELRGPAANSDNHDRATLRIHRYTADLDAVRIAFTSDEDAASARLVVVAFALDGAKDELYEGSECGPRPVAGCESPPPLAACDWRASLTGIRFCGAWWTKHEPPRLARCVSWNLIDLHVSDEILAAPFSDDAGQEPLVRRRRLRRLCIPTTDPSLLPRVASLLQSFGRQITHLMLSEVPADLCSAISLCTRLTHFCVDAFSVARYDRWWRQRVTASAALCDALIASRAPLHYVSVAVGAADAARLVSAVPSIREVQIAGLRCTDLPPDVAARLTWCNGCDDVASSARSSLRLDGGAASAVDLASEFPQLRRLTLAARPVTAFPPAPSPPRLTTLPAAALEAEDIATLPPSLERLAADLAGAAAGARLGQLAARCSSLPHLTSVTIAIDHLGATAALAPLAATAASLRSLTVRLRDPVDGPRRSAASAGVADDGGPRQWPDVLEATLSRLVGLVSVSVPELPTARCFLGGSHTRLRELTVDRLDPLEAPFATLLRRCPRLLLARSAQFDDPWYPEEEWAQLHNVPTRYHTLFRQSCYHLTRPPPCDVIDAYDDDI